MNSLIKHTSTVEDAVLKISLVVVDGETVAQPWPTAESVSECGSAMAYG